MSESGAAPFARLGERVVMAEWTRRILEHETVVEWTLSLDGEPLSVRDLKSGAATVIALHHWDEPARQATRREDGIWLLEVPMAWHSMCVAVSGVLKLEIDVEKREVLLGEDLHVEI